MITGYQFAEQARSSQYNGIPYKDLDCQAFVERVAKDAGIRKKDGLWRQPKSKMVKFMLWLTQNGCS